MFSFTDNRVANLTTEVQNAHMDARENGTLVSQTGDKEHSRDDGWTKFNREKERARVKAEGKIRRKKNAATWSWKFKMINKWISYASVKRLL